MFADNRAKTTSLRKPGNVLPGFGLTLGYTILYLCLVVLIPLSTLFLKASSLGMAHFWQAISSPRVVCAYRLTFLTSFTAALINVVFGLLVTWVIVRYRFPGRRIIDGLIDLPFALPTAVAGICLTTVYADTGVIGHYLSQHGIEVAFHPLGILIALTFIGLPFVVRTVQPVLEDIEVSIEEAAASLGASRFQSIRRIILPSLTPALLTGFALAFARALGEYGSVVFISGNIQYKTEIVPLVIMSKLDEYDYSGATAIAVVMLVASFAILLFINILQWMSRRRWSGG